MEKFITTDDFKNLNVGFSLDEGMASPNTDYLLFNGERFIWREFIRLLFCKILISTMFSEVVVTCNGNPGHGSLLLDNTAGEKVSRSLKPIFAMFKPNFNNNL
jgi:aminoacylase